MLKVHTIFTDSNGIQALGTYGKAMKNLVKACNQAQKLSVERGIAEVHDQANCVLAAFRAGKRVNGSVML